MSSTHPNRPAVVTTAPHERIHRDQAPVTAHELTAAERLALGDLREVLADATGSSDELPETTDPGAPYLAYACAGETHAYAVVDGAVLTLTTATGDLDGQTA